MAIRCTELFCKFHHQHKLMKADCLMIDKGTNYIRTVEESMFISHSRFPSTIITASGMASGGRVLHHLKDMAANHKFSIVFVGFQAPGSRGDALVSGCRRIKIHGQYFTVNADVFAMNFLSAHADSEELIRWCSRLELSPKRVFVTHGESVAADRLRLKIKDELGWSAIIPENLSEYRI